VCAEKRRKESYGADMSLKDIKFLIDKKETGKHKNLSLIFREKAFAIPLVILVSVLLMIFSVMMLNSNTQSKKQRNSTLLTTKAYFMAQAGLQHFKLKYKIKPDIMFDCGRLYAGFSPEYNSNDQFDSISATQKAYPQYLACFFEDVTTGYDANNVSDNNETTTKNIAPSLISDMAGVANCDQTDIDKKKGGYNTTPLTKGGFSLTDDETDDDFRYWGYKPVSIKNGSLKRDLDTTTGKNVMEQSITIEVMGCSSTKLGGAQVNEKIHDGFTLRTHNVRETILLKKWNN